MIDLLYVAFNRLAFTRETIVALLEHTDWSEVASFFILDDGSTDGAAEYLRAIAETEMPLISDTVNVVFHGDRFGGPVAAMNYYLDHASPDVQMFAKIDNDMVVAPGWLNDLLRTMTLNPGLDVLGMEPFVGDATACPFPREITPARHVGGKGLIRSRAFGKCRMVPGGHNGYQGFTQWQEAHEHITKAWVTPDLLSFGIDQIPVEPWRSLAEKYAELGWQRLWPVYGGPAHYEWWEPRLMLPSAP